MGEEKNEILDPTSKQMLKVELSVPFESMSLPANQRVDNPDYSNLQRREAASHVLYMHDRRSAQPSRR